MKPRAIGLHALSPAQGKCTVAALGLPLPVIAIAIVLVVPAGGNLGVFLHAGLLMGAAGCTFLAVLCFRAVTRVHELRSMARTILAGEVLTTSAQAPRSLDDPGGRIVVEAIERLARSERENLRLRVQIEQRLAWIYEQQRAVSMLSQLTLDDAGWDTLVDVASTMLARALNVPYSTVKELDAASGQLILRAGHGWPRSFLGRRVSVGDSRSLGACAVLMRKTVTFSDCTDIGEHGCSLFGQPGLVAGAAAPILGAGNDLYGVLSVYDRDARHFSPDDLRFLETIAYILSSSLERSRRERVISRQQARYRAIFDNIVDGVITYDAQGAVLDMNPAALKMFGCERDDLRQYRIDDFFVNLAAQPGDAPEAGRPCIQEVQARRRGGAEFPVQLGIGVLDGDEDKKFIATVQDISERSAVQAQLRQVQKMDAIGQLTGGIAHDFNNHLTVITGNAMMLATALENEPKLRPLVDLVCAAADRAGHLTRRLLTFSRKEALSARPLDISKVIVGFGDLLRRTLGETISVEIAATAVWPVSLDQSQLESALLNLAINARDAMPHGGRLRIGVGNLPLAAQVSSANGSRMSAGDYVLLTVEDNGIGMAPAVLERVFEPFFTTKSAGRGTGLGLSMVYGFVQQSRGHIRITSKPGQGTTVTIYFPRCEHDSLEDAASGYGASQRRGQETILLVEDDSLVRATAEAQLSEAGYKVIIAADGPTALEMLREHPEIDLVFTDIVMPGNLSGFQLADAAAKIAPHIRILFTSGYAAVDPEESRQLRGRILPKPYDPARLTAAVRAALDESHRKILN